MDFWIRAAQLILSLSILIILHEFGHFIPARLFKTRVEKFYLFFDPYFALFKKKIGDTEWGIGWLPLGGFVKISGMIDESMDKEQMAQPAQPWEFRSKPAWQRLIVMIGGVVVNVIVGVLIYILVLFAWGEEQVHSEDLSAGMAIHPYLAKYDLHSGDNILKIDGNKVLSPRDVTNGLLLRDQHTLTVQKPDGSIKKVVLPDGIEYELFAENALPVAGLRTQATEIHYLASVKKVESIGIEAGDIVRKVNGIAVKNLDLNDPSIKNAKKYEVLVKRDGKDILIPIKSAQFNTFLKAFPCMAAGLRYQDRIVSINDEPIADFDQVQTSLYRAKGKVEVKVLRQQDTLAFFIPVTKEHTIG